MTKQMEKEQGLTGGTDLTVTDGEIDALIKSVYEDIGKAPPKKGEMTIKASAVDEAKEALNIAAGKNKFLEGQKLAQAAVKADKELSFGTAAVNYDKALECFANALDHGFPKGDDKRKAICTTMLSYADRLQMLILEYCDPSLGLKESTDTIPARTQLNNKRRDVFSAMTKVNFQALSRGVDLRKRAKAAQEKDLTFAAYVLYAECLDCFMTYMAESGSKDKNERIMGIVMETLEIAEKLKKEI
eukprot:CAMPEP_0204839952 /NCGR_PEP_ID=MMETSP1346-20131115/35825_1 /ASSEMBLY_ACC=CAM_ASM_000771 /TAXON_ID=215587 /ORGANISM="Aplanochytrium stocchinoi, Strain GSBS06" /LENGTH=243 /DNA_ID=CAMNT_0051977023 /DNA_START=357 /DNA_END=1088 /DNA_ORIENTATION=-